jgi:hypothetical protein
VGVFVKTMALYIYKKPLYNLYKKQIIMEQNHTTKSFFKIKKKAHLGGVGDKTARSIDDGEDVNVVTLKYKNII